MSVEKIFFQSSLPRSGSTLLQNVLGQNPDFYVTPTSGLLELWYGARANYTNSPEFKAQDKTLMKKAFLAFCRDGMFAYFNAITDKKYVVDKSRGHGIHYDFINMFYPQPKIICMVRDLRDVYASMEKNFRANPDLANPILDYQKMQGTTTAKRIDIWAQGVPVGIAIERLSEIFRKGINRNMLFIRFEDFCTNPESEMIRIYEYLELPYYKHDFDNVEQITKEDDDIYGISGLHTIKKKITLPRSEAKQILGTDICNWIYNNPSYQWFFETFNYRK